MTDSDAAMDRVQTARAQAATWLLRLQEAEDDADVAGFDDWLAEDPLHFEAFEKVAAAWGSMDLLANHPDMLRRRRDALDYMHREDVTIRQREEQEEDAGVSRRAVVGGSLAAAVFLAVVGGAGMMTTLNGARTQRYQTGFGERRAVMLQDGSRLSLDEGTRIDVTYSNDRRYLKLLEGQARFAVAHDPGRPFDVEAKGRLVRAVGTEFNVDMMTSSLVVTLIEGRVLISRGDERPGLAQMLGLAASPPKLAGAPIALTAGDQFEVTPDDTTRVSRGVDVDNEIAWEKGQIIFVDEPLDSAVERLNGYARRTLLLDGAAAGRIRISGVFDIDDVPAFVEAVTAYLPVASREDSAGRIILSARH